MMELVMMAPRPKPNPTWQGMTVAKAVIGMGHVGVTSTGALGRAEGYDERADAMRAARMLTRGSVRDAAAVIGYEGRWYVQGVRAVDAIWGSWTSPLRFEAQFPARVGDRVVHENTTFHRQLAGLEAIVDGSRQLRLG